MHYSTTESKSKNSVVLLKKGYIRRFFYGISFTEFEICHSQLIKCSDIKRKENQSLMEHSTNGQR